MKPIRLIHDTTAVVAYARGSEPVGETIAEVNLNNAAFTSPLPCLVEAAREVNQDWVRLLTTHVAFQHVSCDGALWDAVTATMDVLKSDQATALVLLLAEEYDCDILTAEPGRYAGLGDDPPVIGI